MFTWEPGDETENILSYSIFRLNKKKLLRFTVNVACFRYSAKELITLIDSIQAGMFGMVLERVVILEIQKVSGVVDRKITAIGLVKMLCDCDLLMNGDYSKYW